MDFNQMASFVVRFHLVDVHGDDCRKKWRIKVTCVQNEEETLCESIEEAMEFMKMTVEDGSGSR